MSLFTRWLFTFLAFPPAGYLAIEIVGGIEGVMTAAAAGAIAGTLIGGGQWLALRGEGVTALWIAATAGGLAIGSALAAAITGAGTDLGQLMLSGLVAGTCVGAAQAIVVGEQRLPAAPWAAVTGVAWALGWLVTTGFGIDVERGYAVFGASGAIVATVLTGLALRRLNAAPGLAVPV